MTRTAAVVGVAAAALAVATSAAAQRDEMPTRLWSEFPLVQEVERSSTPSVGGPFLPPSDSGTAPASGDAAPWGMWALVAALGLAAVLVTTRLLRPGPAGRPEGNAPVPVQLRPHHLRRPAGTRRPVAQYAPSPALVLADAPEEPWRSVIRRTGLLRSRYVVLEGAAVGTQETIATSRSFWNVGGAEMRERVAEDAWDDLVNDLRATGWEPEPTRRSDLYVLLQPVHPDESIPIVATLDAYGADETDDE